MRLHAISLRPQQCHMCCTAGGFKQKQLMPAAGTAAAASPETNMLYKSHSWHEHIHKEQASALMSLFINTVVGFAGSRPQTRGCYKSKADAAMHCNAAPMQQSSRLCSAMHATSYNTEGKIVAHVRCWDRPAAAVALHPLYTPCNSNHLGCILKPSTTQLHNMRRRS